MFLIFSGTSLTHIFVLLDRDCVRRRQIEVGWGLCIKLPVIFNFNNINVGGKNYCVSVTTAQQS